MAIQNTTNGWTQMQIASGVASLSFTNLPTSVNNFLVLYTNIVLGSPSYPLIQVSTNNGSSYISSGYQSVVAYFLTGSSSSGTQSSTIGFQVYFGGQTTTPSAGSIYLYNMNSSTYPMTSGTSAAAYSGNFYTVTNSGWLNGTVNANAFQFLCSSGTFSGNIKVYPLN